MPVSRSGTGTGTDRRQKAAPGEGCWQRLWGKRACFGGLLPLWIWRHLVYLTILSVGEMLRGGPWVSVGVCVEWMRW